MGPDQGDAGDFFLKNKYAIAVVVEILVIGLLLLILGFRTHSVAPVSRDHDVTQPPSSSQVQWLSTGEGVCRYASDLIGLIPVDRMPNGNIFRLSQLLLIVKGSGDHFRYALQFGGELIVRTMPIKAIINAVLSGNVLRSCVADMCSGYARWPILTSFSKPKSNGIPRLCCGRIGKTLLHPCFPVSFRIGIKQWRDVDGLWLGTSVLHPRLLER